MFRFRLINPGGDDLGPFVSSESDWDVGHRIHRRPGDTLVVTQLVAAEDGADFDAYLVIEATGS